MNNELVHLDKYIKLKIEDLVPADWNYKTDDEFKAEKLKNNIKRNGQIENLIVRELNTGYYEVCNGNHRLSVFKELGFKEVVCYNLGKISQIQSQRIAIETNETKFGIDDEKFSNLLRELKDEFSFEDLVDTMPFTENELKMLIDLNGDLNFDNVPFDKKPDNKLVDDETVKQTFGNLTKRFIIPPFSILDTRQGYWLTRKRLWLSLGIKSEIGRDENLTFNNQKGLLRIKNNNTELNESQLLYSGTSIFDPVLCEIMYKWFCTKGGKILDPFAGGSVRGIVAAILDFDYTGIDLRNEQIENNKEQLDYIDKNYLDLSLDLKNEKDFLTKKPNWIVGNSLNVDNLYNEKEKGKVDFIFSCPPYFDLEKYSDNKEDLSNLSWETFKNQYKEIIKKSCNLLKDNRFACFVVSEVRDNKGVYRSFVDFTKECFKDIGLSFYNELILINPVGTLPIRITRQFNSLRKIGKCHQNVLIFYKGDINKIKDNFEDLNLNEEDWIDLVGDITDSNV